MNILTDFKFNENDIDNLLKKLSSIKPIYFQEPNRIKEIIMLFNLEKDEKVTLVVEYDHVDRQYRDSYYTYFSQKYIDYERNCIRLAFFRNKYKYSDFRNRIDDLKTDFIGTIVLRPLNIGNIGHTLLNPERLKLSGYVKTCEFEEMICGRNFKIKAFPFLSQDNETMTCAQTALYSLIEYYSKKYCEYRLVMPSEILNALEMTSYERVLPSNGMDDACIAKVLQDEHFYPRLYPYENEEGHDFEELVYIHIESGIPFILGLPHHVVICIGHGMVDFNVNPEELKELLTHKELEKQDVYNVSTSRFINEYIFMDDNRPPYLMSTIDDLTVQYYKTYREIENDITEINDAGEFECELIEDDIDALTEVADNTEYGDEALLKIKKYFDCILVPLYRRIFLDAARAKTIIEEHFIYNKDFIEKIQEAYGDPTWGYVEDNPLVWRMYLASSNNYKNYRCENAYNDKIYEYYSLESYPRFIWVLEIGTMKTFPNNEARVEILLDATSSINSNTWAILSIVYNKHLVFVPYVIECNTKNKTISSIEDIKDVRRYFLTEIFDSLYNKTNDFVKETYKIYTQKNLKEI